jgi:hypothetical protein
VQFSSSGTAAVGDLRRSLTPVFARANVTAEIIKLLSISCVQQYAMLGALFISRSVWRNMGRGGPR